MSARLLSSFEWFFCEEVIYMKNVVFAACGIVAIAVVGWCFGAGEMTAVSGDILATAWIVAVLALLA